MGFLSAAGGVLSGIAQHKANQQANKNYNTQQRQIADYLGKYGTYQGGIANAFGYNPLTGEMSGAGPLSGIFGPQTSTGTSSGTTTSNTNMLTKPEVAAENQKLEGMLRTAMENKLAVGANALPPGYQQMLAREAVANAQPQEQAIRNAAVRRGLNPNEALIGSPVEAQRASALGNIPVQAEMLSRQRQMENEAAAGQYAQSRLGQRQTGSTTSTSQGTTSQTGPANYQAILAALGMLSPHEPILMDKPNTPSALATGLAAGIPGIVSAYGSASRPPRSGGGGKFGG